MSPHRFAISIGLIGAILGWASPRIVWGQAQNQGGGGGGQQNQNSTTAIAGIAVDADGVLKMFAVTDRGGTLTQQRIAAAPKPMTQASGRPANCARCR